MAMPTRQHWASGIERSVALGLVLVLHLAALWILWAGAIHPLPGAAPELTATVLLPSPVVEAAPKMISISFARPANGSVLPPQIEIAAGIAPSRTIPGNETNLPPRLDPLWANAPPVLPAALRTATAGLPALIVVVRALVLETGHVAETEVSASSGFAEADAFALRQVRTEWRFLPAFSNGRPIRDWVTVQVLLKSV